MRKFFILSHGRTGTKFLAKLLNGCDGAVVHHEPTPSDSNIVFYSHAGVFRSVLNGMLEDRFQQLLLQADGADVYGECNSYLRFEGEWLKNNLDATVIYLCRDGRDFVRSAYPRKLYTELEPQLSIVPLDGSAYADKWHGMSRFEKICWYWTDTYDKLWEHSQGEIHRVEYLLSDYRAFNDVILKKVGLSIAEEVWRKAVMVPENSTSGNLMRKKLATLLKGNAAKVDGKQLPPWTDWTEEQHDSFNRICGPTMLKLGYELA